MKKPQRDDHPWTQSVFAFNFDDVDAAIVFAEQIAARTGRVITVRDEDGKAIATIEPILH